MKNYLRLNRSTTSPGKIIMGALAGLAAGFTVGILTAPRSGRETRDIIASRTGDTVRTVENEIAEKKDRAVNTLRKKKEDLTPAG